MAVRYIPYFPNTLEGQALLDNFVRTKRVLRYRDNDRVVENIQRGMPYYEVEPVEQVGDNPQHNMVLRGECLSACAYLKDKGVKVDLVYIDPPFASGADYAKKVYVRNNPKVAASIAQAEKELDIDELRTFDEKMYGDIWDKERYLNWMYENLMAIKSVMSDNASIYVHLDYQSSWMRYSGRITSETRSFGRGQQHTAMQNSMAITSILFTSIQSRRLITFSIQHINLMMILI